MPNPTYDATTKQDRMLATRDRVAGGTLEVLTAADALLVAFALSVGGGTVTGAEWTLTFVNNTLAASDTGTAAKAQIKDSGGVVRITGLSCGLTGSGAAVKLDDLTINADQNVQVQLATITHAPDPS